MCPTLVENDRSEVSLTFDIRLEVGRQRDSWYHVQQFLVLSTRGAGFVE
jgi:hypothetical protein